MLPFIFYEDIFDHLPICVEIRCKPNKTTARRHHTRKITQENIDLFLKDLSNQLNTPERRNTKNIDKILTLMSSLTNFYFPLKRLSRKQFKISKKPWITPAILTSIKHKNKLYDKFLKNRSSDLLNNYKKYRNKLTHIKELAKRYYFENLFRNTKNLSDAWKHINQLLRKSIPKSSLLQTIKIEGKLISFPPTVCEELNQHFVSIKEKSRAYQNQKFDKNYIKYLRNRQSSSIISRPTDEFEIVETIAGMNIPKSPGRIDIPVILIKEAKFLIARFFARSFNHCLETGNYPDILRIAKVIPLHKGGYKLDLGNYWPISILSPINKIFETILLKRLVDFREKYNFFTNYQFGFRKLHSTNLAINYLHGTILKERVVNNSVCGIFLDFAKAVDCVNHQISFDKLEHYGVRGNAICSLRSYLTNRFQYPQNSDQQIRSNQLPITIGLPQGSVFGLFLFLVYINGLPNCCDSDMILYADDFVLLFTDKNLEYLKKNVKMNFAKLDTG